MQSITRSSNRTINIGILAHVDAGKTSLTERLLYAAGVIDSIGRVDDGNTQTDTMDLERQRGITIKSAVASFVVNDTTINLIDTPGHPDFIAEVERALRVLDGAVLVVSAIAGVQPQTRVLWRSLQRLKIPTIIFINKVDRLHNPDDQLKLLAHDIQHKLSSDSPGDRLAAPVFAGSAITGSGIDKLMEGISRLLPAAPHDPDAAAAGTVFKIERRKTGDKIAYVRLFAGTVRVRQKLGYGHGEVSKITSLRVLEQGNDVQRTTATAGQIVKIGGLKNVKIGDAIGEPARGGGQQVFAPPVLETAVVPVRQTDNGRLYFALSQLAEQDPLINLRQDDSRQELYVSLYGEVQKQVIQATLASDFGLEVEFRETTVICIERPDGIGTGLVNGGAGDPYLGTVGLRIEPAIAGSGVHFQLAPKVRGTMPAAFMQAVEASVYQALGNGLYGWRVTDCVVILTHTGYWPRQSHAHARFDKSMSSTGADFRAMTPLVLMAALQAAGTTVCEPIQGFSLEVPDHSLASVLLTLAKLHAMPISTMLRSTTYELEGTIPTALSYELQQLLPGITGGDGVLETRFDSYRPVSGRAPVRL